MDRWLTEIILEQTEILLHNVNTTLQTCDLNFVLCGMPVWKHLYHALHSLDRWFINPQRYDEPPFHEQDLNSLDIWSERTLSREELIAYYLQIRQKIQQYVSELTDDMLYEKPEGCVHTRMALILGQYRHLYCHIGNINCTTILRTEKWPRVVGLDGDLTAGLYE